MPMMFVMTAEAAAIAAAEAAAIEAAAVAAAEAAAAEAASVAAAEAAAAQAAQTASTQAAATAGTEAGITQATQQQALTQGAQQGITQAGTMTPQQQAYMQASQASANPGITQGVQPLQAPPTAPQQEFINAFQQGVTNAPTTPGYGHVVDSGGLYEPLQQPSALESGFSKFLDYADKNPFKTAAGTYFVGNKLGLFDQNQANFNNQPYNGPLNNYRLSPDFRGRTANPQDFQYTPRYAEGGIMVVGGNQQVDQTMNPTQMNQTQFAQGGIASYKRGGNLSSSLDYYTDMMGGERERQIAEAQRPAAGSRDVGIYHDLDPDTRYQDALTAAQIRQAKVNKRANMQLPTVKRPTPMGQLNLRPPGAQTEASGSSLDPENAAKGGIMQAGGHLGGYAAGGNPRLLKGPGDGMSDDIPATIANKQPARLADGEFVVPADVVSHLGNGSTEAGAKKLHQMMTNIRKARTGNPKQGKQINPNKFTPK
jgi:hypothetical protein